MGSDSFKQTSLKVRLHQIKREPSLGVATKTNDEAKHNHQTQHIQITLTNTSMVSTLNKQPNQAQGRMVSIQRLLDMN